MSTAATLDTWRLRIEQSLDAALAPQEDSVGGLLDAMRYSALGGGKRIRPLLTLASCRAMGGDPYAALPAASAVEMIHAYSLIHDDLPAMDDDSLRRGRPTSHVVYGEAAAILAGDALHTLAFETLASAPLSAEQRVRLVALLARASGERGMAGGQALDLAAEEGRATAETVERIHRLKTGALIAVCFTMGSVCAAAAESRLEAMERIGRSIGLAFQIQDDVLDLTASTEELGKTAGKDVGTGKATWPALFGVEASRRRALELMEDALRDLHEIGSQSDALEDLLRRSVERRR